MSADDRIEMCRLSCEDSDCATWLSCDPWEARQPGFVNFPTVLRRLDQLLVERGYVTALSLHGAQDPTAAAQAAAVYQPIRVMYLCGADLLLRTGYMRPLRNAGVVCLARGDGSGRVAREHASSLPYVHFVDDETEDMSSTQVRERLARGAPLDDLMYPAAARYLYERVVPHMPLWSQQLDGDAV